MKSVLFVNATIGSSENLFLVKYIALYLIGLAVRQTRLDRGKLPNGRI